MCHPVAMNEPDRVLATGRACGYEWLVTHNRMGFRCGYAKVPPGHPWHGKDYEEIDAAVHGGVTAAMPDQPCDQGDDDGYWIGFDVGHGWDLPDPSLPGGEPLGGLYAELIKRYPEDDPFRPRVRTQEYVEDQCRLLCVQADLAARGLTWEEVVAGAQESGADPDPAPSP